MATFSWKKAFWIFLLLALLLRLFLLPYAKYENETARDIVIAQRILTMGELPLHGVLAEVDEDPQQQSFGPLYYYLIASFLYLYNHPYSAILLAVVMSILSSLACYFLMRRFFDEQSAVVTTVLFMFSPWFLFFVSLNLMTPSMLVLFSVLLLYSLLKVIVDDDARYLVLTALSSSAMLHFHLSSLSVIFASTFILFVSQRWVLFSRKILLPAVLFIILLSPYIISSISGDSWRGVFGFLTNRYESSRFENVRDSLGIPVMFMTTYFGKYLLGSEVIFQQGLLRYAFYAFDAFLVLISFFGAFLMVRSLLHKDTPLRQRKCYAVILSWFVIPLAIAIFTGKNISPHYLLILYPVQFIFLWKGIKHFSKCSVTRSLGFASFIFVVYLAFTFSFVFFLERNGGTDGIYGIPIGKKLDALYYLQEHAITNIAFYKYVKGEYTLLIATQFPEIQATTLPTITHNQTDYLLLDMYSRGNFAEQQLSDQEHEVIRDSAPVSIGKLTLIRPV